MIWLLASILFSVAAADAPARAAPVSQAAPPDTLSILARHVVWLTNRERRSAGLSAVARDAALDRAACRHSRDMLERGFFDHTAPDGTAFETRIADFPRRLLLDGSGENLAGRTGSWPSTRPTEDQEAVAREMVDGWMNSPRHRDNILHGRFTHVGVCALHQGGEIRVTQIFGRIRGRLTPPLPLRATAGTRLPLHVAPVPDSAGEAVRYDFVSRTDTVPQPAPAFNDSIRIPQTTGRYRIRFYFLIPQGYRLVLGPALTIASPDASDAR